MSKENIELVRKAFAGTLAETAQAYWHPDIVYVEDPHLPGASSYEGRDETLRVWQSYLEVLGNEDETVVTVEQVLDAEDRQVAFVRFQGQASASGVPFDHLWGYVVKVSEEQIAYLRAYLDPADALKAAGLSE